MYWMYSQLYIYNLYCMCKYLVYEMIPYWPVNGVLLKLAMGSRRPCGLLSILDLWKKLVWFCETSRLARGKLAITLLRNETWRNMEFLHTIFVAFRRKGWKPHTCRAQEKAITGLVVETLSELGTLEFVFFIFGGFKSWGTAFSVWDPLI